MLVNVTKPIKGRHYHILVYDDLISTKYIGEDIMAAKKQVKVTPKSNSEVDAPVEVPEIEILRAKLAEAEKLNQYYANNEMNKVCCVADTPKYTSVKTEQLREKANNLIKESNILYSLQYAIQRYPEIEPYINYPVMGAPPIIPPYYPAGAGPANRY